MYGKVRPDIEDGDVFLFRGQYLLSKLWESFNRSYYSHVALAVRWGERMMILQAVPFGGIQAVPMSVAVRKYKGRVDWYKLKRDTFEDCIGRLPKVIEEAKVNLGKKYSYRDLLRSVLHWLANLKLKNRVRHEAMFCSEYVEHCFREGGMSLTDKADITTFPKDLETSRHLSYMKTIERGKKPAPVRVWLP